MPNWMAIVLMVIVLALIAVILALKRRDAKQLTEAQRKADAKIRQSEQDYDRKEKG